MIQLRQAEKKDIGALLRLVGQLGYETTPEMLETNLDYYSPLVWVAVQKDAVIGCIACHVLPAFHSLEKHLRIVSLVVEASHRRQGVGELLLAKAEELAKASRCAWVELTCAAHRAKHGAHAFYVQNGFLADGEKIYFRKPISTGKNPEKEASQSDFRPY